MQKHAVKFNAFQGIFRKDKIAELKKNMSSQQTFFKKVTTQTDSIIKARYVVADLIAKNQNHLLMVNLLSNVWKVWQI